MRTLTLTLALLVAALSHSACASTTKFAPIYKFDGSAGKYCFPDWPSKVNDGKCRTQLRNPTPSFVQKTKCGKYTVYTYWLWYGKQKGCIIGDSGHGNDWEHVSVFVQHDKVQKVMFYQHRGRYTRRRGTFELRGERPVVYIGKVGHGSYHAGCTGKCSPWKLITKGCLGSVGYCQGGCGYWDDFRNPGKTLSKYTIYWLNPGRTYEGIKRPDRSICESSCTGTGSRLLTTSGCWQNRA